jgi:hypothetical protein
MGRRADLGNLKMTLAGCLLAHLRHCLAKQRRAPALSPRSAD